MKNSLIGVGLAALVASYTHASYSPIQDLGHASVSARVHSENKSPLRPKEEGGFVDQWAISDDKTLRDYSRTKGKRLVLADERSPFYNNGVDPFLHRKTPAPNIRNGRYQRLKK